MLYKAKSWFTKPSKP